MFDNNATYTEKNQLANVAASSSSSPKISVLACPDVNNGNGVSEYFFYMEGVSKSFSKRSVFSDLKKSCERVQERPKPIRKASF